MVIGKPATMKAIIALISLWCIAHCNAFITETVFQPSFEYFYDYMGQAISGMDGSQQMAGYAQKAMVRIQGMREFAIFKIERMETALINDVLNSTDMTEISYDFKPIFDGDLTKPFKVFYENGKIIRIETTDESIHVINIKKAIATVFQLQLKPFIKGDKSDFISLDVNKDTSVYDVYEDGIAGECRSKYIVYSEPWSGKPLSEVLNVTKLNTFDDCKENISVSVSTHAPTNCSDCDADDVIPVDSTRILKYNIRLEKVFAISKIDSVAITSYKPLGMVGDKFSTNHSQKIELLSMHPMPLGRMSQIPVRDAQQHYSLEVQFHSAGTGESTKTDKYDSPAPFLPTSSKLPLALFVVCLESIISDLKSSQEMLFETPFKVHQCARIIGHFPETLLAVVYQRYARRDNVSRNAVIATFKLSGSLPAIHFLLTLIESGVIGSYDAPSILSSIPFYVVEPKSELIMHLGKVCRTIRDVESQTFSTCWLAFANLVNLACVDKKFELDDMPYCTEQNETVYISILARQLQLASGTRQRLLFIKALEITSSSKIVRALRSIVTGDLRVREMVRVKAIDALSEVENDTLAQKEILSLVTDILGNRNESSVVRISALKAYMASNPRPFNLQRLATITFNEDEDDELVSMISSFIDTTANETTPCYSIEAARALTALPFVKDKDIFIQNSQYRVSDFFSDDLKLSSRLEASWVANNKSIFHPRFLGLEFERSLAGFTHRPLSISGYFEGIESVMERIIGAKAGVEKLSLQDIFASFYNEPQRDYFQLFKKLKIIPRRDEPLSLYLESKLDVYQDRLFYLSARELLQQIERGLGISTDVKLDEQFILSHGFVKHKTPSSLGVPIFVNFKSPAILDLKGSLKISAPTIKDILTKQVPIKVSIQTDVRPTLSINLMTSIGVIDPFSDKYVAVGVQSETFVSLPHQLKVDLDLPKKKLSTVLRPFKPDIIGRDITLFRYKLTPFTVLYPYNTSNIMSKYFIPIIDRDELSVNEYTFGQELLGLPLKFKVKTDTMWNDQASMFKYLFEDNTPLSLATFWWATPDFSFREYVLTMDSRQASKTEIKTMTSVDLELSNIQKMLFEGLTDYRGSMGYLLGWAHMPFQCKGSDMPRRYPSNPKSHLRPRRGTTGPIIEEIPFTRSNAEIKAKLHFEASVSGNSERSFITDVTLERNVVDLKDKLKILTNIQNPPYYQQPNIMINLKGELSYPELPCNVPAGLDPRLVGPINGTMLFEFGDNEHSLKRIRFETMFNKSRKQLESEINRDSWEAKECKEDLESNEKFSYACELQVENVADLKLMNMSIFYKYYELPLWIANATYQAEDIMKSLWYEHMEENAVDIKRQEGRIDLLTEFSVHSPVFNIKIFTPTTQLFFKKLYYPQEISSLLRPINARYSVPGLILDRLTGGYVPPTTSIMKNSLRTFENVSYDLPLSTCKHVITKDCSPFDLFSVLLSKSASGVGKNLEVHLIDHLITARRLPDVPSATFDVIIGEEDRKISNNDPILMLKQTTSPALGRNLGAIYVQGNVLNIDSPLLGLSIKFDGIAAKVRVSNHWRGEVCGITGEFDGLTVDNFVGPDKCLYADVKDLVNSFYVPNVVCPPLPPSPRKICPAPEQRVSRKVYGVGSKSAQN